MTWSPVAPHLCLAFLLQLVVAQTLGILHPMFLLHLPALPDRHEAGGDFVVVQRLRPGAQTLG